MVGFKQTIVSALALAGASAVSANQAQCNANGGGTFTRLPSHDVKPGVNVISVTTFGSEASCFRQCLASPVCQSFVYNKSKASKNRDPNGEGVCYLKDIGIENAIPIVDSNLISIGCLASNAAPLVPNDGSCPKSKPFTTRLLSYGVDTGVKLSLPRGRSRFQTPTEEACLAACNQVDACNTIVYQPAGKICNLKGSMISTATPDNTGHIVMACTARRTMIPPDDRCTSGKGCVQDGKKCAGSNIEAVLPCCNSNSKCYVQKGGKQSEVTADNKGECQPTNAVPSEFFKKPLQCGAVLGKAPLVPPTEDPADPTTCLNDLSKACAPASGCTPAEICTDSGTCVAGTSLCPGTNCSVNASGALVCPVDPPTTCLNDPAKECAAASGCTPAERCTRNGCVAGAALCPGSTCRVDAATGLPTCGAEPSPTTCLNDPAKECAAASGCTAAERCTRTGCVPGPALCPGATCTVSTTTGMPMCSPIVPPKLCGANTCAAASGCDAAEICTGFGDCQPGGPACKNCKLFDGVPVCDACTATSCRQPGPCDLGQKCEGGICLEIGTGPDSSTCASGPRPFCSVFGTQQRCDECRQSTAEEIAAGANNSSCGAKSLCKTAQRCINGRCAGETFLDVCPAGQLCYIDENDGSQQCDTVIKFDAAVAFADLNVEDATPAFQAAACDTAIDKVVAGTNVKRDDIVCKVNVKPGSLLLTFTITIRTSITTANVAAGLLRPAADGSGGLGAELVTSIAVRATLTPAGQIAISFVVTRRVTTPVVLTEETNDGCLVSDAPPTLIGQPCVNGAGLVARCEDNSECIAVVGGAAAGTCTANSAIGDGQILDCGNGYYGDEEDNSGGYGDPVPV